MGGEGILVFKTIKPWNVQICCYKLPNLWSFVHFIHVSMGPLEKILLVLNFLSSQLHSIILLFRLARSLHLYRQLILTLLLPPLNMFFKRDLVSPKKTNGSPLQLYYYSTLHCLGTHFCWSMFIKTITHAEGCRGFLKEYPELRICSCTLRKTMMTKTWGKRDFNSTAQIRHH